jgi:hypothetical protein
LFFAAIPSFSFSFSFFVPRSLSPGENEERVRGTKNDSARRLHFPQRGSRPKRIARQVAHGTHGTRGKPEFRVFRVFRGPTNPDHFVCFVYFVVNAD